MTFSIEQLQQQIQHHAESRAPLRIRGSGSKDFYGAAKHGELIDMAAYSGVVEYEPTELVVTVRAGTSLTELEAILAAEKQMLPFEPPHFGGHGTIGGAVASGLSGPRRAYAGSVRDFLLGARIINGNGEDLHFGGKVIKNVAGYDVSRLMCGAMGTLGVLLDMSFKILPLPADEVTLRYRMDQASAIEAINRWAGQPLPLSASAYFDGTLHVRLSGAAPAVAAAQQKMGGDPVSEGPSWWNGLRDQTHGFFQTDQPLWRVSLPATAPPLALANPQMIEWGGAQRWLTGDLDAQKLRQQVAAAGGHVTLFRGGDKGAGVFQPLQPALAKIHRNLKNSFDPSNILNPGRLDNI
ncbi:MAG: glycolate oxidase subunit GlcE [Burkholderiales bacterium]